MQQWRPRRHRALDIDDVRQYLVLDRDQIERLGSDDRRDGCDRGHGMPLVEDLVAGHDIARQIAEIHRPFADKRLLRPDLGKIGGGHDGAHAGQRQGFVCVDATDPGVRMRAALDLAPEHARHRHVGAEIGPPGDLVHAIGPDWAGADDLQFFLIGGGCHGLLRLGS